MSILKLLPVITIFNPEATATGNGYNYSSYMDINISLPVVQTTDSITTLQFNFLGNSILYNNINDYFVTIGKSATPNLQDSGLEIKLVCNDVTYDTTFTRREIVGGNFFNFSGSDIYSQLKIEYAVEAFNGGYILIRSYVGDSYALSTNKVEWLAPIPSDWYNEFIYDTIFEGNEYYCSSYIQFGAGVVKNNIQAQVSYNMAYYGEGSGAYDYGYEQGKEDGYWEGYDEGYDTGYDNGDYDGYQRGFAEGFSADTTALTIFSGILAIGTLPINIFLSFFNFEVLGINFSELVSSMLSVCVCLIIIKKVFGTNSGD